MSRERYGYDRGGYDRGYDRGGGYDRRDDRDYGRGRGRADSRDDCGVSLLVRNLSYRTTSEELKRSFGRYGEIRDVYIPVEFRSKQPRGFAFIEYYLPADARLAQRNLDRCNISGRSVTVVFAKEKRKAPDEMRGRARSESNSDRGTSARGGDRARSRSRSPPAGRSKSPAARSGGEGGGRRSRSRSRSGSPRAKALSAEGSPERERSVPREQSPARERSPPRERSPYVSPTRSAERAKIEEES